MNWLGSSLVVGSVPSAPTPEVGRARRGERRARRSLGAGVRMLRRLEPLALPLLILALPPLVLGALPRAVQLGLRLAE